MAVTHEGFHAHDGWYFARLDNGSVRISAAVDRCTEVIVLPAADWASVIAAVSAAGETSETFNRALTQHDEKTA